MATVGSLLIVLRGDTSGLQKSFKKAEGFADQFANRLVTRVVGVATIIRTLDRAFDSLADRMEESAASGIKGFQILDAVAQSVRDSIISIPVAGGLFRIFEKPLSNLLGGSPADRVFGAPLEMERLKGETAATEALTKKNEALAAAKHAVRVIELDRARQQAIQQIETESERVARLSALYTTLYNSGRLTIEQLSRLRETLAPDFKGNQLAGDIIRGLVDQRNHVRLTAKEYDALRASQAGAERGFIELIEHAHDVLDAEQVREQLRGPLDVYAERIALLNDLLDKELLSRDEYSRSVLQARETLARAVGTRESTLTAVGLRAGPVNPAHFAGFNVQDLTRDKAQDLARKQLDLTKEQNDTLKQIDKSIRDQDVITVEEVSY